MKSSCFLTLFIFLAMNPAVFSAQQFGQPYPLEVLPSQSKHLIDEQTGAELFFLTDGTLESNGLYFHERSWTQDEAVIVFYSVTWPKGGMAFLRQTEELVRLRAADGTVIQRMTCAKLRPTIYGMAGNRVLELSLEIHYSENPQTDPSKVFAREREICVLPPSNTGALNESCDGAFLALGGDDPQHLGKSVVFTIDTKSGEVKRLCGMPEGTTREAQHVQWSITNPYLLSFANEPVRIWVVDIREGIPWAPYREQPGELVTHEMWWCNDLLLFCGGVHSKPREDAHVKTLNPHTGEVRIVGEGAWWPESDAIELARRNWWHCCGSPDGNWIVADNWHGMLMLFEGKTTRPRLLTQGHRTYGSGTHPHPSWNPSGTEVIFTSHLLGGKENACVVRIPDNWQKEIRQIGKRQTE